MRVEYLEEFESLATTLNYSKVAKKHHLSSSVLSRHISTLESEVGEQLFVRSTTSVALTPAGKRYYEGIVPILEQLRRFNHEFQTDPTRKSPQLHIALLRSSSALRKVASSCAKQLLEQRGVSVAYDVFPESSGKNELSIINRGMADAAITYSGSHLASGWHQELLHRDPFVAIVPITHPLASRPSISLVRDLSVHRTVFLKSPAFQSGANALMDTFREFGVTPVPTYCFAQTQDELCFSPNYDGVLPVPASALNRHPYISAGDHVVVPFEEDVAFTLVMVYPPQNSSDALQEFAANLAEACTAAQKAEAAALSLPVA